MGGNVEGVRLHRCADLPRPERTTSHTYDHVEARVERHHFAWRKREPPQQALRPELGPGLCFCTFSGRTFLIYDGQCRHSPVHKNGKCVVERLRLPDGGDVPEGSNPEFLDRLPDEGGLGNPLPLVTGTRRE